MRAIVVAGGARDLDAVPAGWTGALVIAADSGVDFAYEIGLRVDVAVGDFDSISSVALERAEAEGARVDRHPNEKDETDLELALDEAWRAGATDVLAIGVGGGRLDHLLANLLLLASPRYDSSRIEARIGPARVHIVHGGRPPTDLAATVGGLVTLLAVGGPANGVTTRGLRYPLQGEALPAGTSRGVSNVVESTPATVALEDGTVLAVLPGP